MEEKYGFPSFRVPQDKPVKYLDTDTAQNKFPSSDDDSHLSDQDNDITITVLRRKSETPFSTHGKLLHLFKSSVTKTVATTWEIDDKREDQFSDLCVLVLAPDIGLSTGFPTGSGLKRSSADARLSESTRSSKRFRSNA